MRINILVFGLFLIASIQCYAQSNFQVSGNVFDGAQKEVPFANVLLLRANDSTLVKGAITSETGSFAFQDVSRDRYFVESSVVGYQSARSEVFELESNYSVPALVLIEGESLDEVLVVAEKPLYTQKVDRMVINVEGSIVSSGGTALEVLERSPGVVVNRQSNDISIVGKEGVAVMINGKINYVPTSSLVQLLDGMSADNIESIELITTPPASFDAEGNAGFINIVLKKSANLGLNGSYSLSAGYGKGATSNDNISFNYRKNKLNIFGNYSYLLDQREQLIETSRQYRQDGNILSNASRTERDPSQNNHDVRLGADYQITEKTVTGVILTGFNNKWTMDALNTSADRINNMPVGFVELANTEKNQLKYFGANYNIKHNFTENQFVSMDLDYLFYEFDNPTDYTNRFFDGNNMFLRTELLESRKETPLTTLVGKIDYSNKEIDKFKFEVGAKAIKNDFENDVSVANAVNGNFVIDPTLTNFSVLDETIMAGYASTEYTIDEKTSAKAGVRYEYTDSKLDTDTQGTVVDRQYGIWFPSVFLSRQWTDNLSMNLSFSKRITRPTFNDLAPFVIFFEPNTFISGNASLQPAISKSFKYDINFKNYFLSFQYTDEDSSIANFQERIDPETGRLIFEAANLDYTRTFSVIAGIPVKLTSWWRTQNNLTYVRQKVRSFYLDVPVEQELGIFSANSTHSFRVSDSFSAEVSGFYNGPGFFGNARYQSVYGINVGIQKEFSDKWGTLKFSVNDALDSVEFVGGTDLPDQNIFTSNLFDFNNRTFTLTYTRNFGNNKLKSARDRETGAEEERKRVN